MQEVFDIRSELSTIDSDPRGSNDNTKLGVPLCTSEGSGDGTNDSVFVGNIEIHLGADIGTVDGIILESNDCISPGLSLGVQLGVATAIDYGTVDGEFDGTSELVTIVTSK